MPVLAGAARLGRMETGQTEVGQLRHHLILRQVAVAMEAEVLAGLPPPVSEELAETMQVRGAVALAVVVRVMEQPAQMAVVVAVVAEQTKPTVEMAVLVLNGLLTDRAAAQVVVAMVQASRLMVVFMEAVVVARIPGVRILGTAPMVCWS